ncbi:Mth938-like domain-containing protein [Lichenibacterium dinghuense]|uniref:Mth938-like domain-containing protein n=1 Tax=Lichenibacterium dinghuense TaxID=2895977 RepID=UPI001F2CCFF2|nr:Mth938-like domain-containing protein [Lichenibacterium sp. 6Y81]
MSDPGDFGPGFLAGQHTVDGYGAGGFSFAHVSHRGSILMLPEGVHRWSATQPSEITEESLAELFRAPRGSVEHLLLGTGTDLIPPRAPLRAALKAAGIVVDPMATGAAARTYNILLGERRRVACALIAVA